jgi:polar amino acid transport system substrate-binding protein
MKRSLLLIFLAVFVCAAAAAKKHTKTIPPKAHSYVYHVGVSPAPPFVILEDGAVTGATATLWQDIADTMGIRFEYIKYPGTIALMDALTRGDVDVAITPGTITRFRLSNFAVTVPIMTSRPGVLMKASRGYPMFRVLKHMISVKNLRFIFPILMVLLFVSTMIWLAERKKNPEMFHHNATGIFDGIWWAVVTMTTVGYGDTVPRSKTGRIITILWTFFAIGLLFMITSEIASELTITKFQAREVKVRDLSKVKTVSLLNSGYADGLVVNNVTFTSVDSVRPAISGVLEGKYDAFVFDILYLQSQLKASGKDGEFAVFPCDLNNQYLCFTGKKSMSGLFSRMDPVILQYIQSLAWKETLENYNIPQ